MAYAQYGWFWRYGSRCNKSREYKQIIKTSPEKQGTTELGGKSPVARNLFVYALFIPDHRIAYGAFNAVLGDNPVLGHPAVWTIVMLDLVFVVLGLALFGLTAAYASACDRM